MGVTAGLARERAELVLKMLAPYLAVAVFWCVFHNAWLAILAYHAQILWWSRGERPRIGKPRWSPLSLLVVPSALAGPLTWVLLPYVTRVDLSDWLARYGLVGAGLALMVPYFGLVHPVLEQSYWEPLRERTPLAHLAFAGYHVLVLYSLLDVPWVAACFAILASASWLWQRMTRASGSPVPAVASHIAADLGMVVAAWLLR